MDTTHTWYPGVVCLAPSWAMPVELLSGELLSSWLARIALENGCDPLALTSSLWPERRVWATDVDRFLPSSCQVSLARMAGISLETVSASMLRDVARCVRTSEPPVRGRWPWILAVRARNRKRLGGLQYCPHCLATDRRPYFRQRWRFAWHVLCEAHLCPLLDHCSHCQAPLEPHRLIAESRHQAVCASCGGVLAVSCASNCIDAQIADLQAKTDAALAAGAINYLGARVNRHDWFAILDTWLNLTRLAARGSSEAAIRLLSKLGVAVLPYPLERAWESHDTATRSAMLGAVARITALDMGTLVLALTGAGLTRQCVFPGGEPTIPAFHVLAETLPDRSIGVNRKRHTTQKTLEPQTQRTVEQRMRRLRALVERMRKSQT